MSKRKADFDSFESVEGGLANQGVVQPVSPPKSNADIVGAAQVVRRGLEPVPITHNRPQADTWPAAEGHLVSPRGPASNWVDLSTVAGAEGGCTQPRALTEPVQVPPTSDEEEEGRAANWFWGLLQTPGYEVW